MTSTKNYVLEAGALIAFLQNEDGAGHVEKILEARDLQCLMHGINVCEVFYDLLRRGDDGNAQALEDPCLTLALCRPP